MNSFLQLFARAVGCSFVLITVACPQHKFPLFNFYLIGSKECLLWENEKTEKVTVAIHWEISILAIIIFIDNEAPQLLFLIFVMWQFRHTRNYCIYSCKNKIGLDMFKQQIPGFWYMRTFKPSHIFVIIQTDLVKGSSEVELHFLYNVGQLLLQLQEENKMTV